MASANPPHPLAVLDLNYVWHPFTQMRDWLKQEPIVIVRGKGAVLRDAHGRKYLDANSSIWTNLHGHNHPRINAAIRKQLERIAHSSALGLANAPASQLAQALVAAANPASLFRDPGRSPTEIGTPPLRLTKVFFSDNGSTALEVALKLAFEFSRRTGRSKYPRFLSIEGGYHGDTVGAVSLGHIDLFHKAYAPLLFKTDQVMAPYCYRCPFNRARAERRDAREYRKCHWECVGQVEKKFHARKRKGDSYAGFVFEPLMQGAAGMIAQPAGWLKQVCEMARSQGALLIADEVMTGFGRTGSGNDAVHTSLPLGEKKPANPMRAPRSLFASHPEDIQPDFLALAKGLSGGYVPMAGTLTTQSVFDAFLGEYAEFKTFFHGHSFTGNQIGAAAGLASMTLLQRTTSIRARQELEHVLHSQMQQLWQHRWVGDIRQVGLVVGSELVKNWRTREPFAIRERVGIRVCEAMARRGVLTRPIGNVIVLMPPYCTTPSQAGQMVEALSQSIAEVLGKENDRQQ
jgi:adenosylmethionine-8-amino-7-oxononanoate aminotransferase